jgi:hypothetical protein
VFALVIFICVCGRGAGYPGLSGVDGQDEGLRGRYDYIFLGLILCFILENSGSIFGISLVEMKLTDNYNL